MIEAVDQLYQDVSRHLGKRDFWFEWRELYGKERLIYEKDIKQHILAWNKSKKIIISWEYDDLGYAVLVSSGDDPTQKAKILGGIVCESQKAFEVVYDLLDRFWNRAHANP